MQIFWDYELQLPDHQLPDAAVFFDNQVTRGPSTHHKHNIAVVTCEPFEIIGHDVEKHLLSNWRDYDLILTDKDSLLTLPNSVIFVYGHPWMESRSHVYPTIFGVSSIVGHKMWTIGHRMRHVLWDRRHEIVNIPTHIYTSHHGGPPSDKVLYSDKSPLFDFQFHVAIESVSTNYYLTEKLLDCFQTNVVPIYYGAKNVGDLFDDRGILSADNLDGIIDICNDLKRSRYASMRRYIDANRELAKNYNDFGLRVVTAIARNLISKERTDDLGKAFSFGDNARSERAKLRSYGYTEHSKSNFQQSGAARIRRWLGR